MELVATAYEFIIRFAYSVYVALRQGRLAKRGNRFGNNAAQKKRLPTTVVTKVRRH